MILEEYLNGLSEKVALDDKHVLCVDNAFVRYLHGMKTAILFLAGYLHFRPLHASDPLANPISHSKQSFTMSASELTTSDVKTYESLTPVVLA